MNTDYIVTDIGDVPPDFLAEDLEDGRMYRAYKASNLEGFECSCLAVTGPNGRQLVVPYFVMDFQLNTMLDEGWLKSLLRGLSLKIACVGNPLSENCRLEGEATEQALAATNRFLQQKASLVAYKGFGPDLPLPGFVRVKGLPVAMLKLSPDFWNTMSFEKRRNLRRKLKRAQDVRMVEVDSIPAEMAPALYALYDQTYQRAPVKFEKLSPAYFVQTAALSKYLLFYEKDTLIGFVQMFRKNHQLGLYYGGLDYDRSEKYGLYFVLFLKAIEIGIRDGYSVLNCGLTTYQFKKFLGCELRQTYIYYRHRIGVVNALLSRLAFLLEPSDKELR